MKILETTWNTTGTLHHAYFVVGNTENIASELIRFFEKTLSLKTAGNPDFWHGKFNLFTIDEARALSESEDRKAITVADGALLQTGGSRRAPSAEGLKIFIIQTNFITEQAQNALLKIFEEPTAGTHFFIVMPQDTLLPTLRSRLQVISLPAEERHLQHLQERHLQKDSILKKTIAERLSVVKEIIEGIKNEENTKQDAINLLNNVEAELSARGRPLQIEKLRVCQLTRDALNDNGAPVKMILENLMLCV